MKPGRVITNYYGDYITKEDFDTTVRQEGITLDAVFEALGKKFDVSPDYMRAIYQGTD